MTLFEVDEAANRIRDEVDPDANIIFGSTFDEKLNGKMRVSVVATGIASEAAQQPKPTVISLATTQPAPAQVRTAPAPVQPAFRPTVVTTQAVAAAEPVVARANPAAAIATAAVAQAKPLPMQAAMDDDAEEAMAVARSEQRAEPRIERPEPAFRPEPRVEPSMARTAAPVREEMTQREPSFRPAAEQPVREQLRAEPDMSALTRAVSDIAETQPVQQAPQVRQPEPEPRRMGGLFDLLRRPSNRHHAAPEQAQPAAPAPQPSQPRMAPRGEPTVSRASEDLDIPAFLRRQAN
ncbi:MAG: hypothetical protein ACM3Q1_02620, partial [Bacteroidales bacterium]